MELKQKAYEVLEGIKEVFQKMGLPFREVSDEKFLWAETYLALPAFGSIRGKVQADIDWKCSDIQLFNNWVEPVSVDKIIRVDELIHAINTRSIIGHLFRDSATNLLVYHAGIPLGDMPFDKKEFEKVFRVLIDNGCEFLNYLRNHIESDEEWSISLQSLFLKINTRMKALKQRDEN